MGNDNVAPAGVPESQAVSGVGQTANIGRSTSVAGGAAKVFREFKWGLLTLFLLMVVVIGLVYDGGRKKKALDGGDPSKTAATPDINIDPADVTPPPPGGATSVGADMTDPASSGPATPPPSLPTTAPQAPTNASHNGPSVDVPDPQVAGPNTNTHRTLTPIPGGLGEPKPAPPTETAVAKPVKSEHGKNAKHAEETKDNKEVKEAKAPSGPERSYVVKSGDTLTRIANKELPGKGNVKAILAANKDVLSDANRLKVGMTLKIPASVPVSPTETAAKKSDAKGARSASSMIAENPADKTEKKEAVKEVAEGKDAYTVQTGDTLERIARKLFNDGRKWRSLYEWNREQIADPSRLRVGQTLRVKESAAVKNASFTAPRAEAENKHSAEPVAASMTTSEKQGKVDGEEQDQTGTDVQACSSSAMMP